MNITDHLHTLSEKHGYTCVALCNPEGELLAWAGSTSDLHAIKLARAVAQSTKFRDQTPGSTWPIAWHRVQHRLLIVAHLDERDEHMAADEMLCAAAVADMPVGDIPECWQTEPRTDETDYGVSRVLAVFGRLRTNQKIVAFRFGLLDGRTHTLQETGDQYGITRERVRSYEARALIESRK